jgi:hypothetical protein
MREEHCERIPTGVTMSPQLVKRCQALIRVFISCLCVAPPYCLRLRLHMPRKFRNKLL